MAYRIVLGPRPAKKVVHLLLHLVAMAFAAVGLYAFKVGDFSTDWAAQALLGARYTF